MSFEKRASRGLIVACLLLGLAVTGCSSGNEQGEARSDAGSATISRVERYPGIEHFPRELRKVIRRDGRGLSETLIVVPTMFVLSYSCDGDGRKALTATGYPRTATSRIEIRADGRTVARGTVYPGRVPGPFLDPKGTQTVIARQATSAQLQEARIRVRFDAQGQCRVDDLNLKLHRVS